MDSPAGGDVQEIEAANTGRVMEVESSLGVSNGTTVEANEEPSVHVEKEQHLQRGMSPPDQIQSV